MKKISVALLCVISILSCESVKVNKNYILVKHDHDKIEFNVKREIISNPNINQDSLLNIINNNIIPTLSKKYPNAEFSIRRTIQKSFVNIKSGYKKRLVYYIANNKARYITSYEYFFCDKDKFEINNRKFKIFNHRDITINGVSFKLQRFGKPKSVIKRFDLNLGPNQWSKGYLHLDSGKYILYGSFLKDTLVIKLL